MTGRKTATRIGDSAATAIGPQRASAAQLPAWGPVVVGLPVPEPVRTIYAQADALGRAFPGWLVAVQTFDRGRPRIEVVNREGRNPWVMISSDPGELWAELRRAGASQHQRR